MADFKLKFFGVMSDIIWPASCEKVLSTRA